MANPDVVKQAAGLDLGASLLEFSRPGPGVARGEPLAYLVIDVLQLGEKGPYATNLGRRVRMLVRG